MKSSLAFFTEIVQKESKEFKGIKSSVSYMSKDMVHYEKKNQRRHNIIAMKKLDLLVGVVAFFF